MGDLFSLHFPIISKRWDFFLFCFCTFSVENSCCFVFFKSTQSKSRRKTKYGVPWGRRQEVSGELLRQDPSSLLWWRMGEVGQLECGEEKEGGSKRE